jgi:methionyl-tRNA formyltransferase
MDIPVNLWKDEENLAEASASIRRLRVVLLTADSSRMLIALREGLCNVVALVTPEEYRPGRPAPSAARRLLRHVRRAFQPLSPLESVAAELRVPVLRAWRTDEPGVLRRLEALRPDVLVVAGYPEIFGPRLLALPRLGALNVHASLLPRYRGPQPVAQALLRGEPFTGVTVHYLDAGVDTGDIVAQDVVPILETDTVYTLAARIFELGSRVLLDVLERLAQGRLQRRKQDARRASYFRRLGPEAGRVDWTQGAEPIARLLRLSPWLEVYTLLGRRKMVLLGGRVEQPSGPSPAGQPLPGGFVPGQILYRNGRELSVLCGTGRILLTDWRVQGLWPLRRRASRKLRSGTVLGSHRGERSERPRGARADSRFPRPPGPG